MDFIYPVVKYICASHSSAQHSMLLMGCVLHDMPIYTYPPASSFRSDTYIKGSFLYNKYKNMLTCTFLLAQNLAFSNQLYGKQNLMPDDIKEPLSQVEVVPAAEDKKPEEMAPSVA